MQQKWETKQLIQKQHCCVWQWSWLVPIIFSILKSVPVSANYIGFLIWCLSYAKCKVHPSLSYPLLPLVLLLCFSFFLFFKILGFSNKIEHTHYRKKSEHPLGSQRANVSGNWNMCISKNSNVFSLVLSWARNSIWFSEFFNFIIMLVLHFEIK